MIREIQGAIERIESAEKALAKIAYQTVDPFSSRHINAIIERDLRPAREKLEYVRDAHSGRDA